MKATLVQCSLAAVTLLSTFLQPAYGDSFEGRITAECVRGGEGQSLLYTVGTNFLRVEVAADDRSNPVDIVDRTSGAMTVMFPSSRSFVRFKPAVQTPSGPTGFPQVPPGPPPGIGAQLAQPGPTPGPNSLPPRIDPASLARGVAVPASMAAPSPGVPSGVGAQAPPAVIAGAPAMANMPAMPMMPVPGAAMEFKATGEKTNLLGFACEKFEIKQRGETMEIWATDQLFPFQNYVRNQPPRFGPQMIGEQWSGLLAAKKLFPIRAILHFDNGSERYRFEVTRITREKLTDAEAMLFQPPAGYTETDPLPF